MGQEAVRTGYSYTMPNKLNKLMLVLMRKKFLDQAKKGYQINT